MAATLQEPRDAAGYPYGMHAGRTTNLASIISLLGAFLAAAVVMGLLAAGLIMPAVGAAGAAARSGVDVFDSLPTEFTAAPLSQQSKIVAAGGGLLATPYEENRIIVPLANVAPIMRKAQVAIEDSRFYEHGGVDVRGVVRALASNAAGTSVQGGSTLTQQYVKLMLQETALKAGDKSAAEAAVARSGLAGLTRKLQELKYSIQLEKDLSKDQILQGYFNLVYYGDQAYGVEAASKHYFGGKSAKDLTLPEAALIAGLAQNPGTTDPVNHPDKALARRNVVLDRMYELGVIQETDYTAAKAVPLAQMLKITPAVSSCASANENAYFCDYAMRYLLTDPSLNAALGATQEERKKKIYGGGVTIVTTLDANAAQVAREEIQARVPAGNDVNIGAAAVSVDPTTGAVRAMAQNTRYNSNAKEAPGETSINWAVDTRYGGSLGFQFGSTEKAFALVTALEHGMPINSTVNAKAGGPNVQATYTKEEFPGDSTQCGLAGQTWKVKNDDNVQAGPISLTEATAKSVNTAFVQLVSQLGACNVRDTETRMGLLRSNGEPMKPLPSSITLGTDNVSPLTVASAYGSLGNNGIHCTPDPISAIMGPDQKPLPVPPLGKGNCKQVVDADVAHGVAAIMSSVLTPGGTASASALANGRPAAGKTGTSDRNNETWFAGYTPQLSTAVWVGTPNDLRNEQTLDNVRLAGQFYPVVHGSSVAAPTWKAIMDRLMATTPVVPFPAPSDKVINGEVVAMNDVVGLTVEDATTSLQQQGFAVAVGRRIYSAYRPGIVAGTDPSSQGNRGSLVTLLISAGPGPSQQQAPPGQQPFLFPFQTQSPPPGRPTTPPGQAAPGRN